MQPRDWLRYVFVFYQQIQEDEEKYEAHPDKNKVF